MAEAVTGDIRKPDKVPDDKRKESEEMGVCLLRGSYPSMAAVPEYYEVWQLWNNPEDINGKIAHEVDMIQTMFQLLSYVNDYPECFTDDDLRKWLGERKAIQTVPGMNILRTVVLENKAFRKTLEKFGII